MSKTPPILSKKHEIISREPPPVAQNLIILSEQLGESRVAREILKILVIEILGETVAREKGLIK